MTSANVYLRPALPSDLEAMSALERATDHAPHWPLATYSALLDGTSPQRCLFIAETDRALAGFAVGLMHPPDRDSAIHLAELESVVVAESFRRAGVGRALCNRVLAWCRCKGGTEVVLEVRAASVGAIALYAGLGFMLAGRRPRYYRDPEDDALIMRLSLNLSHSLDEI